MSSGEIEHGELKNGKASTKYGVNSVNVLSGKRKKVNSKSNEVKSKTGETKNELSMTKPKSTKKLKAVKVSVGDLVSADAAIFDGDIPGSFSRDHPDRQHGVVTKVIDKRKFLLVRWVGDGLIMKVRTMDVQLRKERCLQLTFSSY